DQQAVLEARFRDGEADWQDFLSRVQTEMDNGSDLNSRSVRSLAKQWLWSMKSFIQGDEQLYGSIVRMYQQEGPKAASWGTMDTAMFEYILKAVSFLSLAEFTDLRIPTAQIFTPAARRVISLGQEATRQIKLDVFGTEGMLLGLLADETSLVARMLNTAGVTFEVAQRLIVDELGDAISANRPELEAAQQVAQQPGGQLPYAPRAKLVIELALEQAEQLGQTDIAPEHLFLGILEEGQGVATHVLKERLKLDLEHLKQQLKLAMSA
ncbi:MAG: Clp protease N-terminal domain-containing protein, partial [Cyanobacteria bacterium P01_H01_bin.26]